MKYEQDPKLYSRFVKKIAFEFPAKLPKINKLLMKVSQMYLDTYNGFDGYMKTNGEANLIYRTLEISNQNPFRFIDAGCNIGTWTQTLLEANKKCEIEGHLFEISEETIQILMTNQNLKLPNIIINNLALSDSSGETQYLDYGAGSGVNTLLIEKPFHNVPSSTQSVFSITGDNYLTEKKIKRVNLCKIDVEGFEASVLRGFDQSLRDHLIEVIQFEYGFLSPASGGLLSQLYSMFEKYGYKVGRLTNKGVDFREFQWIHNDFRSGPNYVACVPGLVSSLETF